MLVLFVFVYYLAFQLYLDSYLTSFVFLMYVRWMLQPHNFPLGLMNYSIRLFISIIVLYVADNAHLFCSVSYFILHQFFDLSPAYILMHLFFPDTLFDSGQTRP